MKNIEENNIKMVCITDQWLQAGGRAVVFNTEAAFYFLNDEIYRKHVQNCGKVYCDGIGLVIYSIIRFGKKISRLNGPDIFHYYIKNASDRTVVMVGGSDQAHDGLKQIYPEFFSNNKVIIINPVVDDSCFEYLGRNVIELQPDDVLIFFGLRKQERFQELIHLLGFRGNSIGLGAAIDFQSGVKKRAGEFWQYIGLEWLPRLAREPRRLLPRFARSGALFLCFFHSENRNLWRLLFSGAFISKVYDGDAG